MILLSLAVISAMLDCLFAIDMLVSLSFCAIRLNICVLSAARFGRSKRRKWRPYHIDLAFKSLE